MKVTVEIREEVFRTPKTAEQIAEDIRQGATMLWLARGDVTPDGARDITVLRSVAAPEPAEPTLFELLVHGPDAGEDSDFERVRQPPRELPEWDT